MLEVIMDCCSKTYLDMMKHAALQSTSWNLKYPIGLDDKHLKLDIIEEALTYYYPLLKLN